MTAWGACRRAEFAQRNPAMHDGYERRITLR